MSNMDIHLSSEKDYWETPYNLYDNYDKEFNFVWDAACTTTNCRAPDGYYYDKGEDAFLFPWHEHNGAVWLNPPYGRGLGKWIKKAYEESQKGVTVVALIPNRPTKAWFDYVYERTENGDYPYGAKTKKGVEVRALEKRVVFEINGKPVLDKKGKPMPAPFPSAIIIFRGVK